MIATNIRVFITKNGDDAISYTMSKFNYRVTIPKITSF